MHFRRLLLQLIPLCFLVTIACGREWEIDYQHALATAKAEQKCVLLNFTGSDWCPPCMMLEKTAFSKPAFLEYAKKNLILVLVDYPRQKKIDPTTVQQNDRLKDQYGINSFPTVILLSPEGKILGHQEGYGGQQAADLISWAEKLCGKGH